MSDPLDPNSNADWMLLRCVPCDGLFRVGAADAGLPVNCPHCRELLAVPKEHSEGVQPASPVPAAAAAAAMSSGTSHDSLASPSVSHGPRKIREMPVTAEAPKNIAAKTAGQEFTPLRAPGENFAIPPSRPKADYQVPQLMVPNTNAVKAPFHEERTGPRLEHLERIATTSDARFVPDPDAPEPTRNKPAASGRGKGRSIVAWDEDEVPPESVASARVAPVRRYLRFLGIGVLALLFGTLIAHVVRDANGTKPASAATVLENDNGTAVQTDVGMGDSSALLEKLQNKILPLAKAFLDATSPEERLALARDPERVRPLMENYDLKHGKTYPFPYREIGDIASVATAGNFYIVSIRREDYTERKLAIEEIDGRLLVDWESFVVYSEMTFKEFEAERPEEPKLFRVHVAQADYYNYGFTESAYLCFLLQEPTTTDILYGYVKRESSESDVGKRLYEDVTNRNGSMAFATLNLRFLPDSKAPNQVVIDDYPQRGWIANTENGTTPAPSESVPGLGDDASDPVDKLRNPEPPPASAELPLDSSAPSP